MLTEAGVAPLLLESRSPHPTASAATFSLWGKDVAPAHHLKAIIQVIGSDLFEGLIIHDVDFSSACLCR